MRTPSRTPARRARALPPVLAAMALGGCSFIPTYERPASPVPPAYALADSAAATTQERAAADIDWKDYFTDPRLQRLIGIALGNNRDLRVAMLNVEQARAQFQIQRAESVKLTRLRLENGVSSELDNRQATSLAEAARATYAQQQRQRMLDENALVLLLGQPLPEDIRASLPSSRLERATPMRPLRAGLPSDLMERRPDIRQAEQLLLAANANIGAARAAFFPRISLTASLGTVSDELSGLFKGGSWAFSLAPQLALPIFDAGRNQAALESAQVGREIAVAQYEKAIQTAFREVSDALAGQATLQEQLNAQRAQEQADAKRLELSDLRYRNGVASYLDVLDAQRSLFVTQQSLVLTQLQQLQNQVVLYKALGGGWSEAVSYNEKLSSTTPAPQ